jgi:hypothetical protein
MDDDDVHDGVSSYVIKRHWSATAGTTREPLPQRLAIWYWARCQRGHCALECWSATGTLMTAVNICYGEAEKRGLIWFNIQALMLSAGLAVFAVAAIGLVAVLPTSVQKSSPRRFECLTADSEKPRKPGPKRSKT